MSIMSNERYLTMVAFGVGSYFDRIVMVRDRHGGYEDILSKRVCELFLVFR
jgi:hypothetical protein